MNKESWSWLFHASSTHLRAYFISVNKVHTGCPRKNSKLLRILHVFHFQSPCCRKWLYLRRVSFMSTWAELQLLRYLWLFRDILSILNLSSNWHFPSFISSLDKATILCLMFPHIPPSFAQWVCQSRMKSGSLKMPGDHNIILFWPLSQLLSWFREAELLIEMSSSWELASLLLPPTPKAVPALISAFMPYFCPLSS